MDTWTNAKSCNKLSEREREIVGELTTHCSLSRCPGEAIQNTAEEQSNGETLLYWRLCWMMTKINCPLGEDSEKINVSRLAPVPWCTPWLQSNSNSGESWFVPNFLLNKCSSIRHQPARQLLSELWSHTTHSLNFKQNISRLS